tara:strand:+ start:1652 stop:2254 length:603 start_codon:yes stop_codon:yes gene_type:complete
VNEKKVKVDNENENTEMPFWQRVLCFLIFLGWVIYASVTLAKFDELQQDEKDDLDEVCYIILVIQLVILVLSMLFVWCGQIVGGGLPFLINIFWIVICFRFETTPVMNQYALVASIITFIGLGLVMPCIVCSGCGVCCVGFYYICFEDTKSTDGEKDNDNKTPKHELFEVKVEKPEKHSVEKPEKLTIDKAETKSRVSHI